jgi:esterase/lipase superfamily enzyme
MVTKPALHQMLVDALSPEIVRVMTHSSGHFVVLRMLQKLPYSATQFIGKSHTGTGFHNENLIHTLSVHLHHYVLQ